MGCLRVKPMWTNTNEDKEEERVECDEMDMCNERERSEPQMGSVSICVKEKKNMEESAAWESKNEMTEIYTEER